MVDSMVNVEYGKVKLLLTIHFNESNKFRLLLDGKEPVECENTEKAINYVFETEVGNHILTFVGLNERFESECREWFSAVTNSNELLWICNALYSANCFDSEKQFIKDFAKEVLISEKIVSSNKQEYDELVRRYTELAEQ